MNLRVLVCLFVIIIVFVMVSCESGSDHTEGELIVNDMNSSESLSDYAGEFASPDDSQARMIVGVRQNKLFSLGEPSLELTRIEGEKFSVQNRDGIIIEFVRENGKVVRAILIIGDSKTEMNRIR